MFITVRNNNNNCNINDDDDSDNNDLAAAFTVSLEWVISILAYYHILCWRDVSGFSERSEVQAQQADQQASGWQRGRKSFPVPLVLTENKVRVPEFSYKR